MQIAILELVYAVLLGILQGFTEWLPVSSSGHLALGGALVKAHFPVGFYAVLHVGTLAAVVAFFWRDLVMVAHSICRLDREDERFMLACHVLIGAIPTACIGLLFRRFLESLFTDLRAVGIGFLVSGFFLACSKLRAGNSSLSWTSALVIGVAQGAAIAPGLSRSGVTISVGLLSGLDRIEVFRFSYLLSIPAIAGASIVEHWSLLQEGLAAYSLAGAIAAAISGYLAIKMVRRLLVLNRFYLFSIYCFALGLITLTLFH